ncbi:hypothetical protein ACPV3S_17135 [Photobacterium damselae]|uniref:hypothetical protein n=1 Tax=Photobacterium damselae TaxID=38293 RepID=UPI0040676949
MKWTILLLIMTFSQLSLSQPLNKNVDDNGNINIDIPININVIKTTCVINNGMGIPLLVDFENVRTTQNKTVRMPLKISNCSNVSKIAYTFKPVGKFTFEGNGSFLTSNSGVKISIFDNSTLLSNYKGESLINNGNGIIPINFTAIASPGTVGAFTSSINLSIIYI